MEKAAIIDSIELFLKTDSEIEKWFELAINNSAREDKIDDLKESIARREKYTETLCEETELNTRQVKYFKRLSPKKAKDYIERRELERKENRLEVARNLALDKALEANIANKNLAIAEFNRLVREASNSSLLLWLEQECNLSMIVTKLLKKKIQYYMPPNFMSEQFEYDSGYLALLLARIISKPLLNYLNVPENLPDKATFNRAGKLAKELLELVEKHKELVPSTIGGRGPDLFKSVLSQIAIDHLSQAKETKMVLISEDNPRFKEPAMAFVRPLEALKEIRYKEQRRLKVQLLFEDMGIRYINTFALHKNTKGRPHSEIILDLIPPSCSELDDMPDIRTVQRWLSALDGYGATTSTRSPSLSRPFTRNGKVNTHSSGSVSYVRRFIDKPNLKD